MTEDLFVEFEAIPFSVDVNKNVIVSNTILQIKFTIRDNEISQSIQLDSEQQYILRATITTKEQLCALQVILLYKKLGKIAHKVRFQISDFNEVNLLAKSNLWSNIGLVAAQMGLDVLSVQSTCEPDFAKFANSIKDYHLQYFSLYNSFDTKKILQTKSIKKIDFHENQVLLQLAAIKYQTVGEYPLILPLIFGYSAFRLYDIQFAELKNNTDAKKVYGKELDQLRKIFEVSNKIYNGQPFTEQEKPQLDEFELINLFQLPTHFLNTGICLFMFQQLCHVSYLFKAEYFALFSLVKNDLNDTLTNAVISQSSRSGKSVALYTQYFFHLLKGNVPILLNKEGSDDQPLYKYRTHSFHEQLVDQYKNTFELQDLKNYKEKVLADVCKFHTFQLESLDQMSFIYQSMILFINKIQGNLQLVQKLKYDNSIQLQFDQLKLASFFIIDTANIINDIDQVLLEQQRRNNIQLKHPIILVDECLQSQKEKFSKCVKLCQLLFVYYEKKLIKLGKKRYAKIQATLSIQEFQKIDILGDVKNKKYNLAINVISQLLNINLLVAAKQKLNQLSVTGRFQNKGIDLYQTLEDIITSIQFKQKNEIFSIMQSNQQVIIEYFKSLNNILGKSEYILIAMEYLRLEIADYDILDELVVYSPQILNIRNRTKFRQIFFKGMVSYRNRVQYYQDFETNFYKLILQLFNPRGVETAFWKTFSVIAFKKIEESQVDDQLSKDKKEEKTTGENTSSKGQQGMLKQYWSSSVQSLICEYFMNINTKNLHQNLQLMIEKLPKMVEKYSTKYETPNFDYVTVIMVGTDLTVINFLTVNQFSYNILSSRVGVKYINAQILGYVQPHASLLSSFQYEQRRVVVDAAGYTQAVDAIPGRVNKFAEETPILVSLLYSMMTEKSVEMQFMCSSICPSIWFLKDKESKQLNNFNGVKRHKITVNNVKVDVYQMCSLTQTFENIIISKDVDEVKNFVLNKGTHKFDLLNNSAQYNISCIASTTLNSEVVAVLNYQLMTKFIETFSQNIFKAEKIQSLSQDLSKFFSRSILLEFLNAILLVMIISRQSNTLLENLKKVMQTLNCRSVYVQAIVNNKIKITFYQNLVEAFAQDDQQIMFLNPTLDYALHEFSDNNRAYDHKGEDAAVYNQILKDSVQAAREAFEILVRQEKITSLIIIIPFDKQLCFQHVLDQDHKIFDFIITFHGYDDITLPLEMIEGCYVLPVEYGHHIPDFLNQKIMPFGLKNVLQIGLDSKTADLIFKYTGEENDNDMLYMSASALVTQEQEKEKAKNDERIKKILDLTNDSRKYQFYQLTQEDEYITIFDSFIQKKHEFSIVNYLGKIYIFVKKSEDLNIETSLPNLTGMVSVEPVQELSFFNQVFDSRQTIFCCDKFLLKQKPYTIILLDLRFIKDPSFMIAKLNNLFSTLKIKNNFTYFQFTFKEKIAVSQLLDQMQLSVVFQRKFKSQTIFCVKHMSSFDTRQEPVQKPSIKD
ncbi:hypothetical protein SS50377_20005 [Spironucleus salmonicida]|uniref:Uncharacterized protein n=1 Tax=Spironucleus salmonicida TaxID=348837 RepID=A0A9P8LY23_9EUKA|nr:hypothetical protein SS50377_20005 [Spironucleus salmonicida]